MIVRQVWLAAWKNWSTIWNFWESQGWKTSSKMRLPLPLSHYVVLEFRYGC